MAISVRNWYVLIFTQAVTKIKKEFAALSIKRAYDGKGPVEYFLPICFMRVKKFGTDEQVTRKMLFSYVFIRETEAGVREIKRLIPQLKLITTPESKFRQTEYVKVDDSYMSMIKKIANAYSG